MADCILSTSFNCNFIDCDNAYDLPTQTKGPFTLALTSVVVTGECEELSICGHFSSGNSTTLKYYIVLDVMNMSVTNN